MCIFLLPLFYMVSKLAEEKESKAREGMKMMGLNDKSYFTSWFIFMLTLNLTMVSILVLVSQFVIFRATDLSIVFLISLLYGMTLYGFAFMIVAFLQTKKSSSNFASLVHFFLFFIGIFFKGS